MNRIKRLIAYVTAVIIAVTCSGLVSLVSASAAAKITDVKIVSYQGNDRHERSCR